MELYCRQGRIKQLCGPGALKFVEDFEKDKQSNRHETYNDINMYFVQLCKNL